MSPIATNTLTTRIAAVAFALAIVGAGTAAAAAVSPAQDEPIDVIETTDAGTTAPETTTPPTTAPDETTPPPTTPGTTPPETTAPPTIVAITCETARNHGEWVSYVARTTTGEKRGQIIREAARSDCGKKAKPTATGTPSPTEDSARPGNGKANGKSNGKSQGRNGR
jgi:hypothetical protein